MVRWLAIALGSLLLWSTSAFAEEIAGFGRGVEEAKRVARQVALENLQERLARHKPPLSAWQPTLADIDSMLDGPGKAGPSNFVEGVRHSWVLNVHFPTDSEMELRDRRIQRQYGAALAALAAVAGAAVWWGGRERRRVYISRSA